MQHRNAATQDILRPLALVTSSYAARPRDPCARVQHSGRMAAGARTRCADALVQGLAPERQPLSGSGLPEQDLWMALRLIINV